MISYAMHSGWTTVRLRKVSPRQTAAPDHVHPRDQLT